MYCLPEVLGFKEKLLYGAVALGHDVLSGAEAVGEALDASTGVDELRQIPFQSM